VAPRQDNKALWISIAVAGLLLLVLFAATSQQPKTTPVAVPDTDMLFENDMASVPPTTAPEKIEEEEPAGYRASFDCSRASDEIERTICSDAGLAAQDRELADLYRQRLRAAAGLDASDLRASQAAWRDARRRCDDPVSARSCLAQLYSERLTALHADTGAASRDDEGEEMAETPPPPPFESAAPAAAARRAELRSGYISDDDYPASALRANASGTTVVQYTIGVDGRVVDCIVTDSSLNSALDSASCSIVQRRFRFRPAMDAGGKPIEEVRTQRILWRLPAD
jgi:TonB family protein